VEAIRKQGNRFPALDGVRAISILCVFGVHSGSSGFSGGGGGVSIFFSLSGFLITTILLLEISKHHSIGLLRFYVRRMLRLWPALVALVIVIGGFTLVALHHQPTFRHHSLLGSLYALTYSGNWVRAFEGSGSLGFFGHTWSLAVEEQFYLVWPLLFLAGYSLFGRKGVLGAAVVGAVASMGLKLLFVSDPLGADRIYNGTDTAADQLLFGCALAVLLLLQPEVIRRISSLFIGPALVGFVILITHTFRGAFWTAYANTLLALIGTCVIAFLATHSEGKLSAVLSVRPLAYLGQISYGFYLWHVPIIHILQGHVATSMIRIPLAFVLSVIAAALSFHLLEQPLLRWRDANKKWRGDGEEGRRVANLITRGSSSS